MKKTIINLCFLAALGVGLSSCYKDDSVYSPREISRVVLATGATELSDQYTGAFGETFTLTPPTMTQTADGGELSYRWVIYPPSNETDGARSLPMEQTTQTLSLPLSLYGTYDVALHVSNSDNTYIKQFQIVVPTVYRTGLYALLNKSGVSEIAYIPQTGYDSSNESETYKEGLQINNPATALFSGFTAVPSSFAVVQDLRDTYISLAFEDGNTYTLQGNTMQVLQRSPFTADAGAAQIISQSEVSMRGLIRAGQFYSYNTSERYYNRQQRGQYRINRLYPTTYFSDQAAIATTALGEVAVLYDNTNKLLFLMQTANFRRINMNSTLLGSDANLTKWQGDKLVAMASYANRGQVALLLQSTTSSTTFHLASFNFSSGTSSDPIALASFIDVPSSLGLNDASRLASLRDVLYVSADNQVYTNVAGSTSFSSSPLISLPSGQTIVQMLSRTEGTNSYLYVAATDGTTSSIYYYDVTSGTSATEVWSKTGITGKILQLDYRQR